MRTIQLSRHSEYKDKYYHLTDHKGYSDVTPKEQRHKILQKHGYSGGRCFKAGAIAALKTFFTGGLALLSSNVRDQWYLAFTGKKTVKIICNERDSYQVVTVRYANAFEDFSNPAKRILARLLITQERQNFRDKDQKLERTVYEAELLGEKIISVESDLSDVSDNTCQDILKICKDLRQSLELRVIRADPKPGHLKEFKEFVESRTPPSLQGNSLLTQAVDSVTAEHVRPKRKEAPMGFRSFSSYLDDVSW
jgi:hypothetical protein